MPNFKPKANKKIKVKKNANVTLDSKHNEKMKEFENITKKKIPNLHALNIEIAEFNEEDECIIILVLEILFLGILFNKKFEKKLTF